MKTNVYLMGGQSNMCGCGPVSDLPAEFAEAYTGAMIFVRGEVIDSYNSQYDWGPVEPNLGANSLLFGPEVTFSREMVTANGGELIALLKCAWGGTNLHVQWRPPSSGGQTGDLYKGFVEAVHDGIAALDPSYAPKIAGMIWMQGEADALVEEMAPPYEDNLTNLIADLRAEFSLPNMPFVIGQIADVDTYRPPMWGAEVRAAQSDVARTTPSVAIFDTSDLRLLDSWHYDAPGMLELGRRFARAMIGLEQKR